MEYLATLSTIFFSFLLRLSIVDRLSNLSTFFVLNIVSTSRFVHSEMLS